MKGFRSLEASCSGSRRHLGSLLFDRTLGIALFGQALPAAVEDRWFSRNVKKLAHGNVQRENGRRSLTAAHSSSQHLTGTLLSYMASFVRTWLPLAGLAPCACFRVPSGSCFESFSSPAGG